MEKTITSTRRVRIDDLQRPNRRPRPKINRDVPAAPEAANLVRLLAVARLKRNVLADERLDVFRKLARWRELRLAEAERDQLLTAKRRINDELQHVETVLRELVFRLAAARGLRAVSR